MSAIHERRYRLQREREIAQAVNEFNGEQANRGSTGGPQ